MKSGLGSNNLSAKPVEDKVLSSSQKNVDETIEGADSGRLEEDLDSHKEGRAVLISSDFDLAKESSPEISMEVERESENKDCSEDYNKGMPGRKRSRGDGNESGIGGVEKKVKKAKGKPLDGDVHIVGRVLRSRSVAMTGGEKVKYGSEMEADMVQSGGDVVGKKNKGSDQPDRETVEMENDASNGPVGGVKKKFTGKRGRPRKMENEGKHGRPRKMKENDGVSKENVPKKSKGECGRPPKMKRNNVPSKEKSRSGLKVNRKKPKGNLWRPPKMKHNNGEMKAKSGVQIEADMLQMGGIMVGKNNKGSDQLDMNIVGMEKNENNGHYRSNQLDMKIIVEVEKDENNKPVCRVKKKSKDELLSPKKKGKNGVSKEKSGDGMEVNNLETGEIVVGRSDNESDQSDMKIVDRKKSASNNGSVGGVRKKLKGKRGRPPNMEGNNGKAMLNKEEKEVGFNKIKGGAKLADIAKNELTDNLSSEGKFIEKEFDLKGGLSPRHDGSETDYEALSRLGQKRLGDFKKSKGGKIDAKKGKGTREKSTAKRLLSERIANLLLSSGWTVEYRPRNGRQYNDAVYVCPEGKTHWSVTKAYRRFIEQFAGKPDCSFTPIPEEELSILKKTMMRRRTNREIEAEKNSAILPNEVVIKKKSVKKHGPEKKQGPEKKHGAENAGSTRSRKKQNSLTRSGANSKETQNRRRCALLVRSSKEGERSVTDGYIPYSGKRTVLNWMIDMGTVPLNGKVQYKNRRKARVVLEGRITRDGIACGCCSKLFPISKFGTHAGSRHCQSFQNIFLESGASLLQCQLDSWNKQEESERKGFHLIDVDGDDPNDDTCGICADGGDLICCDSCPSTFHQSCLDIQKFPSGDWHCAYCSCKVCGMVDGNAYQSNANHDTMVDVLLTCCLCEEKYHQSCIQVKDAINDDSRSPSFCGKECQELYERLQMLLGVKNELEEGFSWTLIQRCDVGLDLLFSGMHQKVECNSKLAVAFSVMDECFLPLVDHRSGINLIRNILYNCGSNFKRLNYSGFYTAILERSDEIISAASIRIHGNQLAEMPFIGTRHIYRRQGMCSRLLSAIETALGSLGVEKLVIPAISELIDTWTNVFGFKPIEESKQRELRNINMLVFPGIDMLHKPLVKHQVSEGSPNPTRGLISRNEAPHNSETSSSSRPDINISVDGNAPRVQPESGSQPPDGSLNDTSDITSEIVNVNPESSIDLNVNPKFSIDLNVNLDGADKTDCCEESIKGTDIVADTLPQCNSGEDSGSSPEQPVSKIEVDQMSKTQCNSESMCNLSSGSGAMEVVP